MPIHYTKLIAYLPLILLTGALFVGLVVAYRLWHETHEDDSPVTEKDVLTEIENAYYAGEIDEAEMRKVRERLGLPPHPRAKTARADPPRVATATDHPEDDGPSEEQRPPEVPDTGE